MMLYRDGTKITNTSSTRQVTKITKNEPMAVSNRDKRSTHCALLNAHASLFALDDWHSTQEDKTWPGWIFTSDVDLFLQGLLREYKSSKSLVEKLHDAGLFDGVASNNMNDIRSKTSKSFEIDEDGLAEASGDGNALYCWTKLAVQVSNWDSLKEYFEGTQSELKLTLPSTPPVEKSSSIFSSVSTMFSSLVANSIDTTRPVIFCEDKWKHKVGSYFIPMDGFKIEVSIVNLNSFGVEGEPPSVEEIVASHAKRENWEEVSEIDGQPVLGFIFLPMRLLIDKYTLASILGAKNGDRLITGTQTEGYFQINKETPFNYKAEALVVETLRGGSSMDSSGYYKFFSRDERYNTNCYNLVIVKIDDHVVHYSTRTENDRDY